MSEIDPQKRELEEIYKEISEKDKRAYRGIAGHWLHGLTPPRLCRTDVLVGLILAAAIILFLVRPSSSSPLLPVLGLAGLGFFGGYACGRLFGTNGLIVMFIGLALLPLILRLVQVPFMPISIADWVGVAAFAGGGLLGRRM